MKDLNRRVVAMDIETVSLDPSDPKGALDAMTGRIVCIGLLFDDGARLNPLAICDPDERKILERFWAAIADGDVLVGHNILAFDLMFIRQRSWILGIKPPVALNLRKYYTEQVVDLMEQWTNWSARFKGASLDNIAQALGLGAKTGHGSEVAGLWAEGRTAELTEYCMSDVWLSYKVYCRMNYRTPLGHPMPATQPQSSASPYQEMLQATAMARELVLVAQPQAAAQPAPLAYQTTTATTFAPQPVAQQKSAAPAMIGNGAHFQSAQPAVTLPQSPNAPRRPRAPRREQIVSYVEIGGALVLSGTTFPIKARLKELGGQFSKKDGKDAVWQVPIHRYGDVAALCAQNSIRLVAASGELHIQRGA